ncbi:uncharacterized protein [Physcomitrium patens]|uniref:uncharacterized protein isoform X2 n=1 Tax=Physcomitrium patens TaxID=3218 RepID=UPI003CCD14CC
MCKGIARTMVRLWDESSHNTRDPFEFDSCAPCWLRVGHDQDDPINSFSFQVVHCRLSKGLSRTRLPAQVGLCTAKRPIDRVDVSVPLRWSRARCARVVRTSVSLCLQAHEMTRNCCFDSVFPVSLQCFLAAAEGLGIQEILVHNT